MMTRVMTARQGFPPMATRPEKLAASAVKFGLSPAMSAKVTANRFIRSLDFHQLALTTVPQVMVIYAGIILSRFLSAIQRMREDPQHRTSEIRETATRDPLGYALWIFGIPLLQRAFLRFGIPKKYREALTDASKIPESTQGLRGKLRWLNRKLNPLSWTIPSREQVDNQMRYALEKARKAGFSEGGAEFRAVRHFYEKGMLRWRNMATLLGWTVTIGLLGVGVMIFNIRATQRRNAQQGKAVVPPGGAPFRPTFGSPAPGQSLMAQPFPVQPVRGGLGFAAFTGRKPTESPLPVNRPGGAFR
jgi:hypothetical protein